MDQRTVVAADDSPAVAGLLDMALRLEGCLVVTAATGAGALAAIRAHRPAVALVDLGLPDMGGLEVLRRVRLAPELAGTRLVVLTGDATAERESRAAGADAFLAKPFTIASLLATLRPLLATGAVQDAQNAPLTPAA